MNTRDILDSYVPADRDVVERWVEAGRPELVLKEMLNTDPCSPYGPPPPKYLWKALDNADENGPEYMTALLFHEMFSTAFGILLRLDHIVRSRLQLSDTARCTDELLSRLVQLQPLVERNHRHVLHIIKQYAAVKRSLELPEWAEISAVQQELAPAKVLDEFANPATDATAKRSQAKKRKKKSSLRGSRSVGPGGSQDRRPPGRKAGQDCEAPAPTLRLQPAAADSQCRNGTQH